MEEDFSCDTFMESLLPVEESSSDSSTSDFDADTSSNPFKEILRYYELQSYQETDDSISLNFRLEEDEDFSPQSGSQLIQWDAIRGHIYVVRSQYGEAGWLD
jgi:hypothetical protein